MTTQSTKLSEDNQIDSGLIAHQLKEEANPIVSIPAEHVTPSVDSICQGMLGPDQTQFS